MQSGQQEEDTCRALGVAPLADRPDDRPLQERRTAPWPLVAAAGSLPLVVLGLFTTEGDNAMDGERLAALAAKYLEASGVLPGGGSVELRAPAAWQLLYGPADLEMEIW